MTNVVTDLDRAAVALLDPEAIGVIAVDGSDTIRLANTPGARLLGRGRDELLGMPLQRLVRVAGTDSMSIPSLTHQVRQGSPWAGVLEAAHDDGAALRLDATMSVLSGPGQPGVIVIVAVDTRTSAFGRLGWLALHDPLTGLANRALLADRLDLAAAHAARHGEYVAVLFIDLDGFKAVNDKLGHAEGDRVLKLVGERVRELLRPTDTLARYGGDELVAVCEIPSIGHLHDIVERVAEQAVVEVSLGWDMRVSVGAAVSSGPAPDLHELLHRADLAMYRAKASGQPELDLTID